MRIFIILVLICLLLFTIFEPLLRLKEKPSKFWIVLISLLIIILSIFEYKWFTNEQKLNSITQMIIQEDKYPAAQDYKARNVGTHCQRLSEAFFDAKASRAGEAQINGEESFLTYKVCDDFSKYLMTPYDKNDEKTIYTVGVAIHEGFHLKGHSSEAVTECLTKKYFVDGLDLLGTPREYWSEYYASYLTVSERLPQKYQNGEC